MAMHKVRPDIPQIFEIFTHLHTVDFHHHTALDSQTRSQHLACRRRPGDYLIHDNTFKKVGIWTIGEIHAPGEKPGAVKGHLAVKEYCEHNLKTGPYEGLDGKKWELEGIEVTYTRACRVYGRGGCDHHLLGSKGAWVPRRRGE